MDFLTIREMHKNGKISIIPKFNVIKSKDLMTRGRSFYAIFDAEANTWSTDEYRIVQMIDNKLYQYKDSKYPQNDNVEVMTLMDFSTNMWEEFQAFVRNNPDNYIPLDEHITFANTEISRETYSSKQVPYSLVDGSCDAYHELMATIYDESERDKLEWAIGSVLSGDSKNIQKFLVLYGEAGAGKSTILNIIQDLTQGYYTTFDAKALTGSSNAFSTEVFKANPLVAIQHDGDLSRIEDNTKLNSIVSHELMTMNEKYKASYMARSNAFLFMGTNKPVKITDAKSGIIRRLIDVKPSGRKVSPERYYQLIHTIEYELGAIAYHCLQKYISMGKHYYSAYRPIEMMLQTDVFYNFIEAHYFTFKTSDVITLTQAYDMYKVWAEESLIEYKYAKYKFREEMKNYFKNFKDIDRIDGRQVRSVYSEFINDKFIEELTVDTTNEVNNTEHWLTLTKQDSTFDTIAREYPAQVSNEFGNPKNKWDVVDTTLADIDTQELHWVKLPEKHIVIDFDIQGDDGGKSLEKCLELAKDFPATYAETSKSGNGLHLHYMYTGDTTTLAKLFAEHIEIKTYPGNAALRRKKTICNNLDITTISSGLPTKERKVKMINTEVVKTEKTIRNMIRNNLNKQYHPGTKPSIDFIFKILEDAYKTNVIYDVSDMFQAILTFAMGSTNQRDYCVKLVSKMKLKSDVEATNTDEPYNVFASPLTFYDVEVFPNLVVIVYKFRNQDPIALINPTSNDIQELLTYRLVGFNCRRYDNHILYAIHLGYSVEEIYNLSQRIISNDKMAPFREAYNISYTDIYCFSALKQSLKKFEIELGIHHQELGLPWTEPVPENMIAKVVEYCKNDVVATEITFDARKADFIAREILAKLSGLSVNDTTQKHAKMILFGTERNPQKQFIYTDLSIMFPGYKFELGKSTYKGYEVGEGGWVWSLPGAHSNVGLFDVASMHPSSAIALQAFGPYTERYKEIIDARLAIKHKDFELARPMLNYILEPYLKEEMADDLAYALKIVINIVYGLSSAKFENEFRDPRNIDNIIAKRGALFMIDLKEAIEAQGYTVVHVKTDSVKVANADEYIGKFIEDFGKNYQYTFEHEDTYKSFCLVNNAVYVAYSNRKNKWVSVGTQFKHPYVFKKLFSGEEIQLEDMQETKQVKNAMYIDMGNEDEPNRDHLEFIGKVGAFIPMQKYGGTLYTAKDDKFNAVTGTTGYRWLEAEIVKNNPDKYLPHIDYGYFEHLIEAAKDNIGNFIPYEELVMTVPF